MGRTDLGLGGIESSGRVEILEQTATGGFGPPLILSGGMRVPLVKSLGDVDGDGIADLAAFDLQAEAGDGDDAALRLFRSTAMIDGGEQLLAAPAEFGGVSDVIAADVNADNQPDLLAALPQEGVVTFLEGPDFQTQSRLGPVDELRRLNAFPGVNEVSMLATGSTRSVWLATNDRSDPPLQSAIASPAGTDPAFVAAGDLDLDGRPDAVVVDAAQREIRFLRGLEDNRFESVGVFLLGTDSQETPGGLRLRDLDGDGDLDLGLAANTASTLVVMENTGVLPLGDAGGSTSFPAGELPVDLDFADFDGDGQLDVALTDAGADQLILMRGTGPLEFEAWSEIPLPGRPLAILAADLDADGQSEISLSLANEDGSDSRLLVFAQTDSGPFPFSLVSLNELPGVGARIRAGDVNGDGRLDLACGHPSLFTEGVTLLLAGADLTQFEATSVPTGPGSSAFELIDLDFDGNLDFVSARTDGVLGLALGDGLGNFIAGEPGGVRPVVPVATTWLDLADLNGDLRPEVLMVSPQSPHLWVGENTSE